MLARITHEPPAATVDLAVLLYEPEAGRPRVFLRQAQDKLTLRRTGQGRLRSEPPWLPGGTTISIHPQARQAQGWSATQSACGASTFRRSQESPRAFHLNPADRPGLTLHYRCRDYAALQSRLPCLGLATASRAYCGLVEPMTDSWRDLRPEIVAHWKITLPSHVVVRLAKLQECGKDEN
jgi:hypothetical protein